MKRLKKYLLVLFLFLGLHSVTNAQEYLVTFGIQYKPIVPTKFFNAGPVTETVNDTFQTEIAPKLGHVFGMVIRWGLADWLALETGINHSRRNYNLNNTDLLTEVTDKSDFGLVNYQIPLQALIYVKLGEQFYMNTSFGASADMYVSNLFTKGDDPRFQHWTWRKSWMQGSLLANVGFEFRTKEKGAFYIGASLNRPFSNITRTKIVYDRDLQERFEVDTELNGNYLTLDIRYFFHEELRKVKKKDK
jgi:hypothetical protein